jgi:peptidoglycan/LPS O-acetylase OafA/YrhL
MKRDLTYGFYLYHMVFMNLAVHYKIAVAQPLWQCGAVILGISALTLLFAWLSQNFVERPAVKCLKKRG